MKTDKMNHSALQDAKLEIYIDEELSEIKKTALHDTAELAARSSANVQSIIDYVDAKVNKLITYVISYLQNKAGEVLVETNKLNLEKIRAVSREKITQLGKRLQGLRLDLDRVDLLGYNWKRLPLWVAIIGVLAAGDSMLNYRSFVLLVPNLLLSVLLTLVVVAVLAISAHIAGRRIAEARKKWMKWLVFIGASLGVFIFFFLLATLRIKFQESIGAESLITSPVWFALANTFFLQVAMAISAIYMPSDAQRAAKAEQDNLLKKYKETEKELKAEEEHLQKEELKFKEFVESVCRWQVYQNTKINYINSSRELIHAEVYKCFEIRGGVNKPKTHLTA